MRIATWNVNGIRAREAQLCDWLERDRPDIVCLQELKAEPSQIPPRCAHADYHVYWHGMRGYSGVSLHIGKHLQDAEPAFDVASVKRYSKGRGCPGDLPLDEPTKVNANTQLPQT